MAIGVLLFYYHMRACAFIGYLTGILISDLTKDCFLLIFSWLLVWLMIIRNHGMYF